METEDIEKLKEAAFAAAELLKSLPHHGSFHGEDRSEIIAAIEVFKAKPEPFECWANVYQDGSCMGFTREYTALLETTPKHARSAVHLREVTPAPEWERWTGTNLTNMFTYGDIANHHIANHHNAEMQRVTGTEGK